MRVPSTYIARESAPRHILIIKLSAIGDVVHTLAFLDVLHQNFPMAKIDWVVEEGASDLIGGHPYIRRVIISHRKTWIRKIREAGGLGRVSKEVGVFLKTLRAHRYDWVIDLQGLFKSGILSGISRGRRKVVMGGAREGASFFATEPQIPVNYEQHAILRYLEVAAYLGCTWQAWNGQIPVFEKDNHLFESGINTDPEHQFLVAINPMAKWDTKLWEPNAFARLADRILARFDCRVFFTGSSDDDGKIEAIRSAMAYRSVNLSGKTGLKGLAGLYAKCRVLITTDTGPMHMAAAMGCPVVALFGPTSPLRTGPRGVGHHVVTAKKPCAPCFRKTCDHWTCMTEITVDAVFEAVCEVIEMSD